MSAICRIDEASVPVDVFEDLLELAGLLEMVWDLVFEHQLLNIPPNGNITLTDRVVSVDEVAFTTINEMAVYMWPGCKPIELVQHLVHELVHVQQIYEGWLALTEDEEVLWFGVPQNVSLTADLRLESNIEAYRKFPWERMAYEKEEALFAQVCELLTSN